MKSCYPIATAILTAWQMNFLSSFAIYPILLAGLVFPVCAQGKTEPLESLFDECFTAISRTGNADTSIDEQRVTDFGTVTIGKDTQSCAVMGFSTTAENYEISGNSSVFIDRFVRWMKGRKSDFAKARVIYTEAERAVFVVCRKGTWQVIALTTTVESLANLSMRNDPRWLPDFEQVAVAMFFPDGPVGSTC